MKTVTLLSQPKGTYLFSPSKKATLAPGASAVLTFKGLQNQQLAFDRIIPAAADLGNIRCTAKLNSDITLFENVLLSAVLRLFKNRALLYPITIENNNTLKLTITNTSASSQEVNVSLRAYDQVYMNELKNAYTDNGIPVPKPRFLYAFDANIPASTSLRRVDVVQPSVDCQFFNMALAGSQEDDLRVILNQWNDEMKQENFLTQVNDEFTLLRSPIAYEVGGNKPLYWQVTNADSVNASTFSFIADAYDL